MKIDGLSQAEQDINQAIEASLIEVTAFDQFDEKPLEERLRIGDRSGSCWLCRTILTL